MVISEPIDRFTRSRFLLQKEGFERLQNASVIILGVVGVGGFALDCLYRTGVGRLTIVDDDVFEITNQNRQIGSEMLDEPKVFALQRLYKDIIGIQKRVDWEFLTNLHIDDYDVVLDCIDDIPGKVAIAHWAQNKLFSSMGSAKRLNPAFIKVDWIWKTHGDRFARKFREQLTKTGFRGNFKVVFSTEPPHCKKLGSCGAVTGAFGLQLASEAIRRILKKP